MENEKEKRESKDVHQSDSVPNSRPESTDQEKMSPQHDSDQVALTSADPSKVTFLPAGSDGTANGEAKVRFSYP